MKILCHRCNKLVNFAAYADHLKSPNCSRRVLWGWVIFWVAVAFGLVIAATASADDNIAFTCRSSERNVVCNITEMPKTPFRWVALQELGDEPSSFSKGPNKEFQFTVGQGIVILEIQFGVYKNEVWYYMSDERITRYAKWMKDPNKKCEWKVLFGTTRDDIKMGEKECD